MKVRNSDELKRTLRILKKLEGDTIIFDRLVHHDEAY
jgi:hypothetical protein